MRKSRSLEALAAALAALVLSGCGSTVTGAGNGAAQQASGDGLGLSPTTTDPSTTSQGEGGLALSSGGSSQVASSPGASIVDGGSGFGGSSGAGAASVRMGFGVSAHTVNIGIVYTSNGGAANQAVLGAAIAQGNEKTNSQAEIDELNAHGGIAGHKIVPIYYNLDATSSKTYAQLDQEMCAFFTQDNKVFAVNLNGLTNDVFATCMKKFGIIMVSTGKLIDQDAAYFKQYLDYFLLSAPSQDRMMADEVDVLSRLKYFGGWDARLGQANPVAKAKLGVLYLDTPSWTRPLHKILLPGLARLGYPIAPADQQGMPKPQSTSDIASLTAAVQAAVLKFRADNVTHVVVLDASGTMTLLFTTAAKNQGYLPRLGANTATGMQALVDSGAVAANQLAGAVGLGWIPSLDLSAAAAAKYETPTGKKCLALLRAKTGQTYPSANERSIALSDCDFVNFLKAVGDKSVALDERGFQAAANAMGTSYASTGTLQTILSPTKHDVVAAGYDMIWDTACKCAKYVGSHIIP